MSTATATHKLVAFSSNVGVRIHRADCKRIQGKDTRTLARVAVMDLASAKPATCCNPHGVQEAVAAAVAAAQDKASTAAKKAAPQAPTTADVKALVKEADAVVAKSKKAREHTASVGFKAYGVAGHFWRPIAVKAAKAVAQAYQVEVDTDHPARVVVFHSADGDQVKAAKAALNIAWKGIGGAVQDAKTSDAYKAAEGREAKFHIACDTALGAITNVAASDLL